MTLVQSATDLQSGQIANADLPILSARPSSVQAAPSRWAVAHRGSLRRFLAPAASGAVDGKLYAANDPALLAWVHVTEATSFLNAWRRYVDPGMSAADQDRYFAEMAQVAHALGAAPGPAAGTPDLNDLFA